MKTDWVKFLVFVAAGALTGLAAFVNVIKVGSITATAGNQLETQILISLVLGGLPITGGAKVRFSNIIVGTLMYTVLNNGLVMMGFESQTQQLISVMEEEAERGNYVIAGGDFNQVFENVDISQYYREEGG